MHHAWSVVGVWFEHGCNGGCKGGWSTLANQSCYLIWIRWDTSVLPTIAKQADISTLFFKTHQRYTLRSQIISWVELKCWSFNFHSIKKDPPQVILPQGILWAWGRSNWLVFNDGIKHRASSEANSKYLAFGFRQIVFYWPIPNLQKFLRLWVNEIFR